VRKRAAEAHALIDDPLRPEAAAKNTDLVQYASGKLASQKGVDNAVLDDRTVYADAAPMAKLSTISAHDQKTPRVLNRRWTKIKTGH
jgi:putrescine transport system substrate-binding protein